MCKDQNCSCQYFNEPDRDDHCNCRDYDSERDDDVERELCDQDQDDN